MVLDLLFDLSVMFGVDNGPVNEGKKGPVRVYWDLYVELRMISLN